MALYAQTDGQQQLLIFPFITPSSFEWLLVSHVRIQLWPRQLCLLLYTKFLHLVIFSCCQDYHILLGMFFPADVLVSCWSELQSTWRHAGHCVCWVMNTNIPSTAYQIHRISFVMGNLPQKAHSTKIPDMTCPFSARDFICSMLSEKTKPLSNGAIVPINLVHINSHKLSLYC